MVVGAADLAAVCIVAGCVGFRLHQRSSAVLAASAPRTVASVGVPAAAAADLEAWAEQWAAPSV